MTIFNYQFVNQKKYLLLYRLIIVSAMACIFNSTVQGQVRKFRSHEVIDIGNGQKVEILSCRGSGTTEECDCIYYTDRRQTGRRVWQSADKIRDEEKAAKKAIVDSIIASRIKPRQKALATHKVVESPAQKNKVAGEIKAKTDPKRTVTPPVTKTGANKSEVPAKGDSALPITTKQKAASKDTAAIITASGVKSDSIVSADVDSIGKTTSPQDRKLAVVFGGQTYVDLTYLKTKLTIVDFFLDAPSADIHILTNEQRTGGGGRSIQMIFYGQNRFKRLRDTLTITIPPNSTEFERRDEILKGIKIGLVPFLSKTSYAKYLDVSMNMTEQEAIQQLTATNDPWNYWVFKVGTDGTFDYGDVYKTTDVNSYLSIERITDKWKLLFYGSGNYNNYKYSYTDNSSSIEYEILNRKFNFEHALVASLGPHWGVGYGLSLSKSTFNNIRSQLAAKTMFEYSVFPYKDVNTRFITLSYGVNRVFNRYYDSTIYLLTEEALWAQVLRTNMSFTQKWGTFNSTITYTSYLHDGGINNLSASVSFNIRIGGGLFFNVYTSGAKVQDQIYLKNGSVSLQDVLTRGRVLPSRYNFNSGVGLTFRFGSKFNNFVNPRIWEFQ